MLRLSSLVHPARALTALFLLLARPSLAQDAPPPGDDSDDLVVPSSTTAPSATVPAPSPSQAPAASPHPATKPAEAGAPVAPAAPQAAAEAKATAGARADSAAASPVGSAAKAPGPDSSLQLSGYLQAQYLSSALSEDQLQQGGQTLNQNEFTLRRARLRLDKRWDYALATLELDANTVRGPAVGVRRAEASVFYPADEADAPPLLALKAGVFDIPFGFELTEATRTRIFAERTLGSTALFPTEMDAGAQLFGGYGFVRYAVALTNGEPVDSRGFPHDPNAAKDVTARFGAEGRIGERWSLRGGSSFVTGKGFHAGQSAGKSVIRWRDDNEDGTLQASEVIATPGSAATPSKNFDRWVVGVELGVGVDTTLGRTQLFAEAFLASNHDRGYSPADPVLTGVDIRQAGGFVAVTQELSRYAVVGFRASLYDPNSDVLEVRAGKPLPKEQTVKTYSPLVALVLPGRAKLTFQYDIVRDYRARDRLGVPTDADNDQWLLRLQVEQ